VDRRHQAHASVARAPPCAPTKFPPIKKEAAAATFVDQAERAGAYECLRRRLRGAYDLGSPAAIAARQAGLKLALLLSRHALTRPASGM
jgi:hypothetical protein